MQGKQQLCGYDFPVVNPNWLGNPTQCVPTIYSSTASLHLLGLQFRHFSFPSHYHRLVASTTGNIYTSSLCSHKMIFSTSSCMQTFPTLQSLQVFADVCCRPECPSSLRELALHLSGKKMVQLYLQLSTECRLAGLSEWQPFTNERDKNSTHLSVQFLLHRIVILNIHTCLNACVGPHE